MTYALDPAFYDDSVTLEPTRAGFGRGLKLAGEADERVVGLCADLTESVQMHHFAESFPKRFVQTGIAEQNLVTVAAGMARAGKIPFAASYAAFSPGRNWEQIKTTACINELPVKIVGGHAGVTVGPDGATHQMLEDIALMRVLPRMTVVVPGDSVEAEKAVQAIAKTDDPTYIRLARDKSPVFSTSESPFEIGRAYVLRNGTDVTLCGTGIMTAQCLLAANMLEGDGTSVEVVHVPTIKPLDRETLKTSVAKTGRVVSAEEAQAVGGLGSAIAEFLCDEMPAPLLRIGVYDRFGESGMPQELLAHFELDAASVARKVRDYIARVPQYKPGF